MVLQPREIINSNRTDELRMYVNVEGARDMRWFARRANVLPDEDPSALHVVKDLKKISIQLLIKSRNFGVCTGCTGYFLSL